MARVPRHATPNGKCQAYNGGKPCTNTTRETWHVRCEECFEAASQAMKRQHERGTTRVPTTRVVASD